MKFLPFLPCFLAAACSCAFAAEPSGFKPGESGFRDELGRHFIPHGFVTITGDGMGDVPYTAEDYRKMALAGANFQVIRIFLGKLGGVPGREPNPKYLEQLDEMVELGRQAGMKSAFKLTVYDATSSKSVNLAGFQQQDWIDLYLDKDGRQDRFLAAWRRVFERYKDNPSVFGYDLVNEPCAANRKKQIWEDEPRFKDSETFQRDYFIPFYRKLIDELHRISPEGKLALFQPYHVPPPVHIATNFPCLPLSEPLRREGIVFAPHYYNADPAEAMKRYTADAVLNDAPMMFGEYGTHTTSETDHDLAAQQAYTKTLIDTVTEFDRHAVGCVKAWWCGSRVFNQTVKTKPGAVTWALFYGDSPMGNAERKYIMDVIVRPRPLVIAGTVNSFHFDFATRIFEMRFAPDSSKGKSEIFVPVERHYPDGFRVLYNGLTLAFAPESPGGFRVVENTGDTPASAFHWDAARNRILVDNWGTESKETTLKIIPGTSD